MAEEKNYFFLDVYQVSPWQQVWKSGVFLDTPTRAAQVIGGACAKYSNSLSTEVRGRCYRWTGTQWAKCGSMAAMWPCKDIS